MGKCKVKMRLPIVQEGNKLLAVKSKSPPIMTGTFLFHFNSTIETILIKVCNMDEQGHLVTAQRARSGAAFLRYFFIFYFI